MGTIQYTHQTHSNQRTSGPENVHLTDGPGLNWNVFIHAYSQRAGVDNPWVKILISTKSSFIILLINCKFSSYKSIRDQL